MKKIITYVVAGCLAISGSDLFGQTTTGEGFESATAFPPTGWQTVGGGFGGPTWSRRTTANAEQRLLRSLLEDLLWLDFHRTMQLPEEHRL